MTDEKREEISYQLENLAKAKQLSQKRLATMAMVNVATVNNIIKRKWLDKANLISDQMWRKMAAFLGLKQGNSWKIRRTKNLTAIYHICDEARNQHRMMAISGATGFGKTTALEHYSEGKPNTYYVLCTCLMSQKSFIKETARAMGVDSSGTKEEMMSRIFVKLRKTDSPLLILDDVGKVSDHIYRMIQLIYDMAVKPNTAGIILAGVPYLKNYIRRMADKDKMGFKELKRRIGYWLEIEKPSLSEVTIILKDYEIIDRKMVAYIHRNTGNFGSLEEFITEAKRKASGEKITQELLLKLQYSQS